MGSTVSLGFGKLLGEKRELIGFIKDGEGGQMWKRVNKEEEGIVSQIKADS